MGDRLDVELLEIPFLLASLEELFQPFVELKKTKLNGHVEFHFSQGTLMSNEPN